MRGVPGGVSVSPCFPTAAQRGSWLAHGKLSSETPSFRGTGVGVTVKGELWMHRLTGFLVRRLSLPRTWLIRDPGPKARGLGPEVHSARSCSCFWLGCCGRAGAECGGGGPRGVWWLWGQVTGSCRSGVRGAWGLSGAPFCSQGCVLIHPSALPPSWCHPSPTQGSQG